MANHQKRSTSFDLCNTHKPFIRNRALLNMGRAPVHPKLIAPTSTSFAGDDDGVAELLKGKTPGFDYDAERRELCPKQLPCGHPCADPAAWRVNPCTVCRVPVTILRGCGHATTFYCGRGQPFLPCMKDCGKLLVCGHPCYKKCSDILCGKGTCGGYRCVAEFPEEQKELEELRALLPPENKTDEEGW